MVIIHKKIGNKNVKTSSFSTILSSTKYRLALPHTRLYVFVIATKRYIIIRYNLHSCVINQWNRIHLVSFEFNNNEIPNQFLIDYDGARLCLRIAATNGPIVHPPGDMWPRRAMVMTTMPARDNSWLVHQSSLVVLEEVKFDDMGPPALLLIPRKVFCAFLSSLKIHRLGRVWTRDPCVQWQAH
jgi:hypothetical protein